MATSKVGLTTNAITGILPTANGGTGNTSGAAITATANGADNRVATYSSATALNGEANLKFDGVTLTAIGDNGTTGLSPHGTYDNIVIDDNGSSGLTYLGSTTANQQIRFDDSGGNRGVISYNHDGDTMSFGTAGADRALITSTGILGLGAGNASADLGVGLHVKTADSGASAHAGSDEVVIEGSGDAGLSILSGTSGDGTIRFGDSGDNQIGRVAYSHSTNILSLWAGGTDRLSVDADSGGGSMAINGTRWDDWYRVQMRWSGNNYGGIVLDNSDTDSNEANYLNFKEGNTSIGKITKNGTSAAILYTTTSDYRLKENVTDKTDGIEKIKLLKPKKFNWIADASNQNIDGFLAHEVQEVIPEAITGVKDALEKYKQGQEIPEGKSVGDNKLDENGNTIINPQGIDKSSLVPLLTSALQEAITKIETLETKVTALENA